ncbi:hypothetical protein F5Y10DRAFT_233179 [Nemania abortiva]|nr:hypothetical protein F5Y10DRAFT_233179 [Nemania abortiva]
MMLIDLAFLPLSSLPSCTLGTYLVRRKSQRKGITGSYRQLQERLREKCTGLRQEVTYVDDLASFSYIMKCI